MLLKVRINGVRLDRPYGQTDPGVTLEAFVSEMVFSTQGGPYLLQIRLADYQSDVDYFRENAGKKERLGDLPSLLRSDSRSVSVKTEEDTLYDILFFYNVTKCDPARISTGELPSRLTPDEVKLMIIGRAGISLEDAKDIPVEVVYNAEGRVETGFEPIQGYKVGDAIFSISSTNNFHLYLVGISQENLAEKLLQAKSQAQ